MKKLVVVSQKVWEQFVPACDQNRKLEVSYWCIYLFLSAVIC